MNQVGPNIVPCSILDKSATYFYTHVLSANTQKLLHHHINNIREFCNK